MSEENRIDYVSGGDNADAAREIAFSEATVTVEPDAAARTAQAAPETEPDGVPAVPSTGSDEWQARWNAEMNRVTDGGIPPEEAVFPDTGPIPNAPVITPVKKRKKAEFTKKAVAACAAVILGCGSLGLGLSFGGQIANRLYPDTAQGFAQTDLWARQAFSFSGQNGSQIPVSYGVQAQPVGLADVFNAVSESVVSINLTVTATNFFRQSYETPAAGSGIIYDIIGDKVYIATNNHVIESAESVSVSLDDQQQVSANFVGSDPNSDLAVISVSKAELDKTGIPYKKAVFGDSDAMRIGDAVLAVGNAMGEGKTATSGIISGIGKEITVGSTSLKVLQTNAAINPGNSGGALANAAGEVIGVNTAKLSDANVEGVGYSIPSNIARDIFQSLMENGSVAKPVIGVRCITVDQQMMEQYDFPSLGVLIGAVTPGGAADKAGIKANDIIVELNGVKTATFEDLSAEVARTKVGDEVSVKAYRNGGDGYELKDFSVTVQDGNANAGTPNF